MKIDFQVVKENEDGSADCILDMDKDAVSMALDEKTYRRYKRYVLRVMH